MLALTRVREARWPGLTPFEEVAEVGGFHDGEVVGEVHGDADFGRQGAERQTYEVLSFCDEVLRYGPELHRYHRRLYAWALCFPVGRTETFVVAANNFGRIRRLRPSAVFLERRLASRLDVPFAQEEGFESYLSTLLERALSMSGAPQTAFGPRPGMADVPTPFRDPAPLGAPSTVAGRSVLGASRCVGASLGLQPFSGAAFS